MNENYLQFIWKMKRVPLHLIKTTDQKEIVIKNFGIHNLTESGPDFYNGRVFINGIEWIGTIEIHIKSSDWYRHKHQNDSAYSNVILHVVFEHDCDVFLNDEKIPTIELKNHIDWEHFNNWEQFLSKNHQINCVNSLQKVNSIYIESMMEKALNDRLHRKAYFIHSGNTNNEPQQVLYSLIARAFGAKVNQLPFEELATRLPLSLLKKYSVEKQISLLYWTSGLIEIPNFELSPNHWIQLNNHYSIGNVAQHSWKRKGLRPKSNPEIRISQFSELIAILDFEVIMEYLSTEKLIKYFKTSIQEVNKTARHKISNEFSNLIIINSFVPFLWWYGNFFQKSNYQELAFDILTQLKAEKNGLLTNWKNVGVEAASAYESQALIELYNEFCFKNKCLSCAIGISLLK